MLANVRLGQSNGNILCIGDSTTAGYNGVTHTAETNNSWVYRAAALLTAKGFTAGANNWFGDKNVTSNFITYQAMVGATNWGSAWNPFLPSLGGNLISCNSAALEKFTFTTGGTTDTLDLYWYDGSPSDNINVFGGAGATAASPSSVANTASNTLKKTTFTSAATTVWAIAKATANTNRINILGMNAYTAATKQINLFNMGGEGLKTSDFTANTNGYDALKILTDSGSALAGTTSNPNLAFYFLGINDAIQATTSSTLANMQTVIQGLQASNTDVVVVAPFNFANGIASQANQAIVQSAAYQVATSLGCAVIPLDVKWGAYADANALGYYGDTAIHPSNFAYQDIAASVANFILRLAA